MVNGKVGITFGEVKSPYTLNGCNMKFGSEYERLFTPFLDRRIVRNLVCCTNVLFATFYGESQAKNPQSFMKSIADATWRQNNHPRASIFP